MKPLKLYNFPLTLAVLAAVFLFQGCLRDRCDMSYTYAKYSPVYMSQAEFENAVSVQPARAIVNPGKIFVKDAFLFVNETGKGVHIFDNKNPAQPQALAFLSVPGTYELAFNCDNLILDSSTDLLVFDMSNPQSPELVSRTRNSLPGLSEYKGFVADPSKGVVVEWIREIVTEKYDCEAGVPIVWQQNQVDPSTMDQSDLSARTINPTVQGKAGSMSRFAVLNDYLYAVLPSEMIVYHMASCDNVAQVGRFSMFTQSGMAEMITSMNDLLLVGGSAGVDIYNTQTPETPQYISSFAHVQACDPVAAQGGYAYVTLRNGDDQPCGESFSNQLDVLDISAPQYPTLLRTFNMHNPHGVAIDGNLLFIADGSEGLKVFDATKPEEVGSHQIAQFKDYFGYDVIPYNGVLVMVGEDGISQYSYSDPKNIQLLSAIPVESAK